MIVVLCILNAVVLWFVWRTYRIIRQVLRGWENPSIHRIEDYGA